MNEGRRTYSISFYSSLPHSRKSWREIRRAKRIVERNFLRAHKRLRRELGHIFDGYPNNHHSNAVQISVNVDKGNADHCGAVFCPEDSEIVINKYAVPISDEGEEAEVMNLFADKKRLRHNIVHELVHYAFTEYEYADGSETPVSWTVGLCSQENTSHHVGKKYDKKWKTEEWLDEVLTERLAMHISGWTKSGLTLYENNVGKKDKHIFEKVKDRLINGPLVFENMVEALYRHDKDIFLNGK